LAQRGIPIGYRVAVAYAEFQKGGGGYILPTINKSLWKHNTAIIDVISYNRDRRCTKSISTDTNMQNKLSIILVAFYLACFFFFFFFFSFSVLFSLLSTVYRWIKDYQYCL